MNLFRHLSLKHRASTASIAFLAFFALAEFSNVYAKKNGSDLEQALHATDGWKQTVDQLEAATAGEISFKFRVRAGNKYSPKSLQFLSTNPDDYVHAQFVRSLKPTTKLPRGSRLLKNVVFEYGQGKRVRKSGTLSYVIVDKDGRINEIGAPTEALEEEFRNSLSGVTPSPKQIARIEALNRELFDTLKSDPRAQAHVASFLHDRKWPAGSDKGKLAFFSNELTPLESWAKSHGYSLEEMRNAGWMNKTFDNYGRAIYSPTESNSIKIPYFADAEQNRITKFNSRLLYQIDPETPKYKAAGINKTFRFDPAQNQQLYNSQLLEHAEGKTVVITEGELKALFATESTGIITTAIPGISQFSPSMMRQLVQANAKKLVVLLDCDPLTDFNSQMGDGITNTQRAAYHFATSLKHYGATNAFVGKIPCDGEKVGADDLLLNGELKATSKKYQKIIEDSVRPEQYAKELGLNPKLEDLLIRRQALTREVKFYKNTSRNPSPEIQAVIEKANAYLETLEPTYKSFLPKPVKPILALVADAQGDRTLLPPIKAASANDWAIAQKSKQDAVLQISLKPTIYGRGEDPLADIANSVSRVFPDQELTTLRRGMSLPVLNFPDLSLEDARKLAVTLRTLSAQEIEAANLLSNVTLFDPKKFKIASSLREGVERVGIAPQQEYLDWRKRLVRLLSTHESALGEKLQRSIEHDSKPIIELADWKPSQRRSLKKAKSDLHDILKAELQKTRSKAPVQFNWSESPLNLATVDGFPNDSAQMSFRISDHGKIETAPVSKWTSRYLSGRGMPTEKSIELYTETFLKGDPLPISQNSKITGGSEKVKHAQISPEDFNQKISPELRGMIDNELTLNGSGRLPARLENELGAEIYHSANTLINYGPERAAPILDSLKLPKQHNIFGGYGVYGSTTNKNVKHPSDTDLLYNSIITVPDSIETQEEATLYARKIFRENILNHYAKLARENKLTILEFRTGSAQTMKLPSKKISGSERFMDQPTLTQEEFLSGSYKDITGKTWTLDELLALEEFPKLKLEVYEVVNGKRVPKEFSVQFLTAFNWKNERHFMRKGGIKGLRHSPVSTAAYYGADSYAAAMLLERPMVQSAVQFGPGEVNSIRELLARGWSQQEKPIGYLASDPLLSTKFLKEFNRAMSYLEHSSPEIQLQIFSDTKAFMEKLGTWDKSITPETVTRSILKSINAPRVATVNELKNAINTFSEYNQRNQQMPYELWVNGKNSLIGEGKAGSTGVIGKIRKEIQTGNLKPSSDFMSLLDESERIVRAANESSSMDSIMKTIVEPGLSKTEKVNGLTFGKLEKAIVRLQNEMHTQSFYRGALKKPIQDYIKTSVAIAPHSISRAVRARGLVSDDELGLRYQLLGISDTPENIERMKYIDKVLDTASPDEVKKLQTEIVLASERDALLNEAAMRPVPVAVDCVPRPVAATLRQIIQ